MSTRPVTTLPRPSPHTSIVLLALAATVVQVGLVLFHLHSSAAGQPASLVTPGVDGPSADLIARDFPRYDLPDGIGHDGQQFYAMARSPFDPDQAAAHLDRPRYRLQRPLLPLLAWLLHPTGGGAGLVWALFAVGTAATFAAGWATGVVAWRLGGRLWPAAVAPLLPGMFASLRMSTADGLALALTMTAVAAAACMAGAPTGRMRLVRTALIAATIGALLAKESSAVALIPGLIGLIGWKSAFRPLACAGAVALSWKLALITIVPGTGDDGHEVVRPMSGLSRAWDLWFDGREAWAWSSWAAVLLITALIAIGDGRRHRLFPAVLVQLAFLSAMHLDVIGLDYNATRALAPASALLLVIVATATRPLPVPTNAPARDSTNPVPDPVGAR